MKLRNLFFAIALILTTQIGIAQTIPLPATEVLNAAIQKAKKENKHVLAIFHASWCGGCHKMIASLENPTVKPYFDRNYVIADFTVYERKGKENLENPGAADLLKRYNNADQGLPTWLVFDDKRNLIADSQIRPAGAAINTKGENVGCPAKPEEVAHLIASLKKVPNSPIKNSKKLLWSLAKMETKDDRPIISTTTRIMETKHYESHKSVSPSAFIIRCYV